MSRHLILIPTSTPEHEIDLGEIITHHTVIRADGHARYYTNSPDGFYIVADHNQGYSLVVKDL